VFVFSFLKKGNFVPVGFINWLMGLENKPRFLFGVEKYVSKKEFDEIKIDDDYQY
jgi:hypothetical protein